MDNELGYDRYIEALLHNLNITENHEWSLLVASWRARPNN
jgi:hypothetical protein